MAKNLGSRVLWLTAKTCPSTQVPLDGPFHWQEQDGMACRYRPVLRIRDGTPIWTSSSTGRDMSPPSSHSHSPSNRHLSRTMLAHFLLTLGRGRESWKNGAGSKSSRCWRILWVSEIVALFLHRHCLAVGFSGMVQRSRLSTTQVPEAFLPRPEDPSVHVPSRRFQTANLQTRSSPSLVSASLSYQPAVFSNILILTLLLIALPLHQRCSFIFGDSVFITFAAPTRLTSPTFVDCLDFMTPAPRITGNPRTYSTGTTSPEETS
jgi:hypothetical protein